MIDRIPGNSRPEIDRMLAIRDWIRENPADRNLDAQPKIHLAEQSQDAIQDYADATNTIVREIWERLEGSKCA